jgi:hypothetical protein
LDDFCFGPHFIELDTFLALLPIHPYIFGLLHCIYLQPVVGLSLGASSHLEAAAELIVGEEASNCWPCCLRVSKKQFHKYGDLLLWDIIANF